MYNGNALLRGPNETFVYTDEMTSEIIKCMSDIIYFGENYCHIVTGDGRVKIKFYEYQKRMLKAMFDPPVYESPETGESEKKKHVVCLCPRQQGKCVYKREKITIRNKKTGEIKEIEIGEFHDLIREAK